MSTETLGHQRNLLEEYNLVPPPAIAGPAAYGSILIKQGVLTTEDAATRTDIQILHTFLATFIPGTQARPDVWRPHQRKMLREEVNINLGENSPKAEIEALYAKEIDLNKVLGPLPSSREIAILALKMALDYAEGKWPKIQFGTAREDFMPIQLGNSTEIIMGRTLNILQEALTAGESIEDVIALFQRLSIHLWRSPAIQALENARMNLRIMRSGIRTVAAGTNIELTEKGELEAVAVQIAAARQRIGGAIRDLEEQFAELFPQSGTEGPSH